MFAYLAFVKIIPATAELLFFFLCRQATVTLHQVRFDYLMFYAQSNARDHTVRAKQNVFLPKVQILIHYLSITIYDTRDIQPLKLGEKWRK